MSEYNGPRRGDAVERWIKRRRDEYPRYDRSGFAFASWIALDGLLDDYRLHADTGTSLDRDVSMTQQPLVSMTQQPLVVRMEPMAT